LETNVRIYILPGGHLPERKTSGAIGFDVYLRAIVSPTEMDLEDPNLRKTLFDFETVPLDELVARHIKEDLDRTQRGAEGFGSTGLI